MCYLLCFPRRMFLRELVIARRIGKFRLAVVAKCCLGVAGRRKCEILFDFPQVWWMDVSQVWWVDVSQVWWRALHPPC